MSSTSYDTTCPECDSKNLMADTVTTPFSMVFGKCLDCGFSYFTEVEQLTLQAVNAERHCYELKPLKKLKKKKWRV